MQGLPRFRKSFLLILFLVTCLLSACASDAPAGTALEQIEGDWISHDGRRTSIKISGDSLHFYEREDHWYATTFILPAGTKPQQLRATITDSAPPKKDIGEVVVAIINVENDTLRIAVGGEEPPATFEHGSGHYELTRVTGD